MTDQESTSSSAQDSKLHTPAGRATIIIGIGVVGGDSDLKRFLELWTADSERRAHRINDIAFDSRLQILPLEEGDIPHGE